MVGEALAEIPGRGEQNKVIDVERKFPANKIDDLPAVRTLREWTFPEYGERIEPRLTAMMRHDTVPAVIPKVIRSWRDR